MNRAYGVMEFRAVDDDQRILEGIANTDDVDDFGTIIEPEGARFSLPIPLLWQHDRGTPVGEVMEATVTKRRIRVRAQIRNIPEAGSLKDDCDRAWQAVKHRLVRGLSIGFMPVEGGYSNGRFTEWKWRELSIVTLPANEAATIQKVRSAADVRGSSDPGRPGLSESTPRRPMKTIQEQITQHENSRAAKIAQRQAIIDRCGEESRTPDNTETEQLETLATEVRSHDEYLTTLYEQRTANERAARPVNGANAAGAAGARGDGHPTTENRNGVPVVRVNNRLEPGIGFARHVMALLVCRGNTFEAAEYARRTWGDGASEVVTGLREGLMSRSAVAPGTTAQATFAAPLVVTNYANEFLELLRPMTLIGRIPGFRKVPFNTSMPAQTAGGTYKWVGQGKPKPVTNAQYAAVTLSFAKASGIIVLTEELVKLSTPSAEAAVRDEMLKGIQQFLDGQLVDPAVAAVSNVNPASITNGVTGTAASGVDVSDAYTDIAARIQAFAAANFGLGGLVILMSESMAFVLGIARDANGDRLFPDLRITGGSILGIPVVTSETVGAQIIFVHAPSILYADDGGVDIDVSREASVQLDSAPTDPADAATVLTSLWQHNLVGLRAERFITWGKARSTAVDRITSVAYVA